VKDSIRFKLENLVDRQEELNALLSDPSTMSDQNVFRKLSIELSEIGPVIENFLEYRDLEGDAEAAQMMIEEDDKEMRKMAHDELSEIKARQEVLLVDLQKLLLPKDPNDDNNIFLEIRAGTGGDEAAIFSGDLFKMYSSYAESQKWKVEVLSKNEGDHGGYKEIISRIEGHGAYSKLKFESGAHRVQRVPETETQGRVHTSACTVAVLPEADDAMSMLKARILDAERQAQAAETAETRKSLVGSGDRSERIRTYNYPQGRVTDHRINLTLYKLDTVMTGELSQVVDPLTTEHQANLLSELSDD